PGAGSSAVTPAAAPPAAVTRMRPLFPGENTMTLSRFQVPPRPSGASHSVTGGPPVTSTFFSFPEAKKAMYLASGDQNGNEAFAVPGIGRATSLANGFSHSW